MAHSLSPEEIESNNIFQDGYRAGYNHQPKADSSEQYLAGWGAGFDDRAEDEEALATGDFDGMSESEREWIYGNESDQP